VLVAGDFKPPIDAFVLFDAWETGDSDGNGATWSRSNPWAAPTLLLERHIDYVFSGWPHRGGVGSVIAAELVGTEPENGVIASDYYGMLVQMRY
jgi:hypothetical protein